MALKLKCPRGERLTAPETAAGKRGRCSKCGHTFTIPDPKAIDQATTATMAVVPDALDSGVNNLLDEVLSEPAPIVASTDSQTTQSEGTKPSEAAATASRRSVIGFLTGSKYTTAKIDSGRVHGTRTVLNSKWALVTTACVTLFLTAVLAGLLWPSAKFDEIARARQELEASIPVEEDRIRDRQYSRERITDDLSLLRTRADMQMRSLATHHRRLWVHSMLSAGFVAMFLSAIYPLGLYLEATVRKRITGRTAVLLMCLVGGMVGPTMGYYLGDTFDLIKLRIDQQIFTWGGLFGGVVVGLVLGLVHAWVTSGTETASRPPL